MEKVLFKCTFSHQDKIVLYAKRRDNGMYFPLFEIGIDTLIKKGFEPEFMVACQGGDLEDIYGFGG